MKKLSSLPSRTSCPALQHLQDITHLRTLCSETEELEIALLRIIRELDLKSQELLKHEASFLRTKREIKSAKAARGRRLKRLKKIASDYGVEWRRVAGDFGYLA